MGKCYRLQASKPSKRGGGGGGGGMCVVGDGVEALM